MALFLPTKGGAMISADATMHFLQVARRGRLKLAAESMGVDHTTVSRQITRLERDIGHRLFDRAPSGWTLTGAGRDLIPHAEEIESALRAAESIGGRRELSGTVRVITPDAFGAFILSPGIASLTAAHPQLQVQMVTSTQNVVLSTREFDVAVTLERPHARSLVTRKMSKYRLSLYATREYLASAPPLASVDDLRDHRFIWYVDDLLDIGPLRQFEDMIPGASIPVRINSVTGHWQAALSGMGIAPLPCYVGDQDQRLVSLLRDDVELWGEYWLAVPREYLILSRVNAVIDLLDDVVRTRRNDMLGRPSPTAPRP